MPPEAVVRHVCGLAPTCTVMTGGWMDADKAWDADTAWGVDTAWDAEMVPFNTNAVMGTCG